MNWDDPAALGLEEFLTEWQRATDERSYQPQVGDSSLAAAERFIAALVDLEAGDADVVAAVAHGGVTVDALRTIAGDAAVRHVEGDLLADGVPCCAITRIGIADGSATVIEYPSTRHLDQSTGHRPA